MSAFLLWHIYERDGGEEEAKLIGVYSTAELAEKARERAAPLPGFRDHPAGFVVACYEVDRDHWTSGFVTVPR